MNKRCAAGSLAAILAFATATQGCGTIMGFAGEQDVRVQVNPDDAGAVVKVNGLEQGKGSGTYKLDAGRESNSVEVSCQDGRSGSAHAPHSVRTFVVVADAFLTLCIGIFVDYSNGALYEMPKALIVNLGKPPEQTTASQPDFPQKPASGAKVEMHPCPYCNEPRPNDGTECPHCGVK
jgi:hypothetical protein